MMYALGAAGCKPLPIYLPQSELALSMASKKRKSSIGGRRNRGGSEPTKMSKSELLEDCKQKKLQAKNTGIFSRLIRRFRRDR